MQKQKSRHKLNLNLIWLGVGVGLGVRIRGRCSNETRWRCWRFFGLAAIRTHLLLARRQEAWCMRHRAWGIFGVMGLSCHWGIKNPTVVFWPRVKQLSFVATRNYPTAAVPFCRHCNWAGKPFAHLPHATCRMPQTVAVAVGSCGEFMSGHGTHHPYDKPFIALRAIFAYLANTEYWLWQGIYREEAKEIGRDVR